MASHESYSIALVPMISAPAESRTDSLVDVATLAHTYSATLFRVAHSLLRNPDEASDVVQDVFLRVLNHRDRIDQIEDLRVWLIRIAWNLALDRRKRKRPDQLGAPFAHHLISREVPADRALEHSERFLNVLAEIDRLPRQEREALLLSTIDELAASEIGRILNRTESATRALIHRARTRLQKRLEGRR